MTISTSLWSIYSTVPVPETEACVDVKWHWIIKMFGGIYTELGCPTFLSTHVVSTCCGPLPTDLSALVIIWNDFLLVVNWMAQFSLRLLSVWGYANTSPLFVCSVLTGWTADEDFSQFELVSSCWAKLGASSLLLSLCGPSHLPLSVSPYQQQQPDW